MTAPQTYIAVFPILEPTPLPRLERQAINQLATMIPDDVTLTGHDWDWTIRGHPPHAYLIAQRPANGPVTGATALANMVRADLPDLAATLDAATAPGATPIPITKKQPYRAAGRHLDDLEHLLAGGTAIEDAIHRCGWTRARTAAKAAYRDGRTGLGNSLEKAA